MRHAGFLAVPFFVLGSLAAAEDIPPAEEQAKATLEKSPRHGEWIDVKMPSGGAPIKTWVVYPERKEKAGVVLVIHEIFGLSDWVRSVADQLAKEGFIAVAPDLLSGKGPGGGGTESAASRDDVVKLVQTLTQEETNARLSAVREWAIKLPSANARSASARAERARAGLSARGGAQADGTDSSTCGGAGADPVAAFVRSSSGVKPPRRK